MGNGWGEEGAVEILILPLEDERTRENAPSEGETKKFGSDEPFYAHRGEGRKIVDSGNP